MASKRQVFYFKAISGILIFFFFVPIKGLPVTIEELENQYQRAKREYFNKKYEDARERLERLAAVYETIKNQTAKIKKRYGQVHWILGASFERTGDSFKAKFHYKIGLVFLPQSIPALNMEKDSLPVYRKVTQR